MRSVQKIESDIKNIIDDIKNALERNPYKIEEEENGEYIRNGLYSEDVQADREVYPD